MERDKPQAKDAGKPSNPLGSHPIGTAVGGLTGAVAGGAVAGSVAGPAGTAVGAATGAAVGGVGGKLIADLANPQLEKEFWRKVWADPTHTEGADLEAWQRARDLAEPEPGDEDA